MPCQSNHRFKSKYGWTPILKLLGASNQVQEFLGWQFQKGSPVGTLSVYRAISIPDSINTAINRCDKLEYWPATMALSEERRERGKFRVAQTQMRSIQTKHNFIIVLHISFGSWRGNDDRDRTSECHDGIERPPLQTAYWTKKNRKNSQFEEEKKKTWFLVEMVSSHSINWDKMAWYICNKCVLGSKEVDFVFNKGSLAWAGGHWPPLVWERRWDQKWSGSYLQVQHRISCWQGWWCLRKSLW